MNELFLHHDGINFDLYMLKDYASRNKTDASLSTTEMMSDGITYKTTSVKMGFMSFDYTTVVREGKEAIVSVSYDSFTCKDDGLLINFISGVFINSEIEKKEVKKGKSKGKGYKQTLIAAAWTAGSFAMLAAVCIFHAMQYAH